MKTGIILFMAPLVMLAAASCQKPNKQNAVLPPTPVSVATAKVADAVYYDQYQGVVVALNTVELRSEVSGFITGIFFKEGEVVPKGKALYEIDRRKYEAAYQQAAANLQSAEANLVKAQKDIDRYTMLLKNDAIARQTVDQAQAAYETSKSQVAVAKAGVLSARTDLSYATITAPFTGRIGISQVKLGAQVSPGTTLLNTISSGNPIGVDVIIDEQAIDRFYALQKRSTDSTFRLQLSNGDTYNKTGKVLAIDRGVASGTGTIKVRIQFPNDDDVLRDGMSCVLNVLNNQSGERVQIPYKAVSEQMGEFFVFVSLDTIARQHKVKLGPRIGGNVVIMSGINTGDKVITDGFQRLRDGGKITLGPPAQRAPQNKLNNKQGFYKNKRMIADTFIRRPVTAIVISIVIVVVGILAITSLPIGQYPEITPPTVQITGNYAGADAVTVEQTVATPIEVQVNGTPGMTYLQSNSTSNGQMTMTANFEVGTDINIAALDVQTRVGIATPALPQDVQRLGVVVRKRNPSILMLVAIFAPNGSHDVTFVDNYTNVIVKDALSRTKGVGDVISRADDFSMRIWLKPDKLAALGMTAADVTSALAEQNAQVAAGVVGVPPQEKAQPFEYTVLVRGRLSKPEEFANIIVKTTPGNGAVVHLKDVARVELGKFNYAGNSFVDGKRASYLLIYQAPNSNSIETADNVYATMNELKKSFPEDIDYVVPFESITVVRVSVGEVVKTLAIALVLVIIVVFLFLQSWRTTLIPVLAIPVSIIGTFIFFMPLHFTINTLTLFGFVLAIGIVVDDAIVVVEAVQHYMDEKGMSPKEATIHAMKDISAPVIAIALVLAAVFVPVGFIPGIVGRLYQQFAITIAISVLISAFVALSLTPALCTLLLRPRKLDETSKGLDKFFFKFNEWFARVTGRYRNGVDRSIKNSKYIVILLLCIIAGAIMLFKYKPTGFIPLEDDGRIYVTYDLPEAASTQRTVAVLHQMMAVLDSVPGILHYAALGGLNAVSFASKSNSATMFVQLKPWDERTTKETQIGAIIAALQKRLARFKEASVVVIQPPAIPGLGSSAGFSFILEEKQAGGDVKVFEKTLRNLVTEINKRPEISKAFSFFTASTPAYQLTVDREKAKKLGVAISDINNALQTYLGSIYVNDLTLYGRTFHVLAQADTNYRTNIQNIGQYFVRNSAGNMVPLSTLTSYKLIENAPLISHYNLFRSAEIDGSSAQGYSSGDALTVLKEVADKTLPQGFGYEFSGLSREELLSGSKTVYIFMLSIGFVFLFLAALYESWSVPFSVLLAVPLGAFGAILFLTFQPNIANNIYAQIGLITLIGLAAKNAILIVEFAKERVDRGMELEKSVLEAVRLRLRPILMTSLAFIFGVLPLVFATGAGAQARQTIGWTVFGGMLAATSLAIFIVPVLFYVITRFAYGKTRLAELEKNYKPDPDHDPQS